MDTKSILQMARGAFQERVDLEMTKVVENILDPNTKPTQKRKLTMTIEFSPDDERQNIGVSFVVKSTMAPTVPARTTLWVAGENTDKERQIVEMVPQVPGQMSFDNEEQEAPTTLKLVKIS